jgi:hypothetical protein
MPGRAARTVPLQILQLIATSGRDEVLSSEPRDTEAGAWRKESVMYVFTIHSISDPDAFWAGPLDLSEGTELPIVVPSSDGTRGVCVFKSDSVDTVKHLVEAATGQISTNEYYAINEGSAMGLPS